ncbi:hypothetical protein Goshw_023034 [Gossypium schwendimanii]|uniref:Uncharacterized protein n=1 Tax=Gossypium schwendimanii TaxID=34291 RepID=A0A7J9MQA2_GOSSC|nr:hypothetical protein [Gossypium schwendimanii]
MTQLRVNQEASTSVISGKGIREPSGAPGIRSFATISSNISTHLNPIIEGPMKVAVSLRECVFDPSKHKTVVFKENIPLNLDRLLEENSKLEEMVPNLVGQSKIEGPVLKCQTIIGYLFQSLLITWWALSLLSMDRESIQLD